jgi:hypothetical protein
MGQKYYYRAAAIDLIKQTLAHAKETDMQESDLLRLVKLTWAIPIRRLSDNDKKITSESLEALNSVDDKTS